jgi:hypothetical protein
MMGINIDFCHCFSNQMENRKKLILNLLYQSILVIAKKGLLDCLFFLPQGLSKLNLRPILLVSYNDDPTGAFWSHFDLIDKNQEVVFISFVQNLIESASYCITEEQALRAIKQRFITWKSLFKKNATTNISCLDVQGVYGESFVSLHLHDTTLVG